MKKVTHVRQTDTGIDRELREIIDVLNEIVDKLGTPGSSFPADSAKTDIQAVNVRGNLYSLAVKTKDGMIYSLPGIFVKTSSIPSVAVENNILKADTDGNFSPQAP